MTDLPNKSTNKKWDTITGLPNKSTNKNGTNKIYRPQATNQTKRTHSEKYSPPRAADADTHISTTAGAILTKIEPTVWVRSSRSPSIANAPSTILRLQRIAAAPAENRLRVMGKAMPRWELTGWSVPSNWPCCDRESRRHRTADLVSDDCYPRSLPEYWADCTSHNNAYSHLCSSCKLHAIQYDLASAAFFLAASSAVFISSRIT